MATPTKFRAVGAALMRYQSADECEIAAIVHGDQALDYADTSRWLPVSFLRTPSRAKLWKDVWMDDRGVQDDGTPVTTCMHPGDLDGAGITSLGPLQDLPRAQYLGAVYLRDEVFRKHYDDYIADPQLDPRVPPFPWRPTKWFNYELTSVAYEGDATRRYLGVEAEVVSLDPASKKARLAIYPPMSRTKPIYIDDVELDNPAHCDLSIPADPEDLFVGGPSEKMMSMQQSSRGGVYLNLRLLFGVYIGPKLPIWMGF